MDELATQANIVKCHDCGHQWIGFYLPLPIEQACKIIGERAGASDGSCAGRFAVVRCAVRYPAIRSGIAVRRLTPRECERLQGFPDDYTLITFRRKPAADGPRYKALGNSKAVPVVRW